MAPFRQASLHLPQASLASPLRRPLKSVQCSRSSTGMLGTAWGKGVKIAVRWLSPASNSLAMRRLGQAAWQSPQPLHRSSSTERAFWRMVTLKLPM